MAFYAETETQHRLNSGSLVSYQGLSAINIGCIIIVRVKVLPGYIIAFYSYKNSQYLRGEMIKKVYFTVTR